MRQPKLTHKKYIAPIVAKQKLLLTLKVYAKESIRIFIIDKNTHTSGILFTFVWQSLVYHIFVLFAIAFQKKT